MCTFKVRFLNTACHSFENTTRHTTRFSYFFSQLIGDKRDSCRLLFKELKILTQPSQYIYSLLVSVAENKNLFLLNKDIHKFNTRSSYNLHLPLVNLTVVQRGVFYSGCKIFNKLPSQIRN